MQSDKKLDNYFRHREIRGLIFLIAGVIFKSVAFIVIVKTFTFFQIYITFVLLFGAGFTLYGVMETL